MWTEGSRTLACRAHMAALEPDSPARAPRVRFGTKATNISTTWKANVFAL